MDSIRQLDRVDLLFKRNYLSIGRPKEKSVGVSSCRVAAVTVYEEKCFTAGYSLRLKHSAERRRTLTDFHPLRGVGGSADLLWIVVSNHVPQQ